MGRSYRSQSKTVREKFLLIQGKFCGCCRSDLPVCCTQTGTQNTLKPCGESSKKKLRENIKKKLESE